MLQTSRRRDPYPFTWEIPVAILLAALLLFGAGVQLGRSLAYRWAGAGWVWPTGRAWATSIPAILAGDPGAGLHPAPAAAIPSGAVLSWVLATEAILALAATLAAVIALRHWGPGRMRGMASPAEAATTLGLRRLRAHRAVIRPDLHPGRAARRVR
ncbi:MAG: hypothetical protein QM779_11650 [Propionicimonas sp.]|uniref:hypothetical protein n=1 Tax=Propionicimonas sp. TaxID=1955623 RepID=UPI003D0A709C